MIDTFDPFRKKRNISSYDVAGSVSDKEAKEMYELAAALRGRVENPFALILAIEGAPCLSRFLRQGGEFDLPRTGWSRSRNPRPVPAKSAGTRTGHPLEQFVTKGEGQPPRAGRRTRFPDLGKSLSSPPDPSIPAIPLIRLRK
jgi:hypothetical protein